MFCEYRVGLGNFWLCTVGVLKYVLKFRLRFNIGFWKVQWSLVGTRGNLKYVFNVLFVSKKRNKLLMFGEFDKIKTCKCLYNKSHWKFIWGVIFGDLIFHCENILRTAGLEPTTIWLKVKCSTNWAIPPYI